MTIELFMKRRKLTQGAFANLVGLSESQLSRIRTGEKRPSVDSLIRIHNATRGKVTFRDIVGSELDPGTRR